MKSILRALALTGVLGLGAAAVQAQVSFSVGFGAPVVAVPPSPGIGYVWTPGYYYGNLWVPGRWVFEGYGPNAYVNAYSGYYGGYYGRDYDRDRYRGDDGYRDRDRYRDGDRYRDRDDRHDRGRDNRGHDDFHHR